MNNIKQTYEQLSLELEAIKQENAALKEKCSKLEKEHSLVENVQKSVSSIEFPDMHKLLDDYLRMYAGRDDELTTFFSENFSGFTGGGDFLVKDKKEWIAITRQDFAQVKDIINLEQKDFKLQKLSDIIFVATSFFKIHLPIKDHILSKETARLVLIFQKEPAGWKIAHSSISIPYHLVRAGEVYPMLELESRNQFLEDLISERTIQLSEANRKLNETNKHLAKEITEHKAVQDALLQSNQKLEAIISSTPDGIGLMSLNGEIQLMSDKVAEIYGYSLTEMDNITGKSIFDFIDQSCHSQLTENMRKIISGEGTGKITEYLAIRKDKTRINIDVNSSLLYDSGGNPVSILFVERDVTERKKAELIIQKQNKELFQLNATKDKLFSIIAHDLRSPFQGFIGITKLIAEETNNFSQEELLKIVKDINRSAINLHKLLLNLLDWARMQEGSISFNPVKLSLSTAIADNNELILSMGIQKGIEMFFEIPEYLSVYADEAMFNSILRNLLSNALKFTRPGGKVTVKAKAIDKNLIEFSISDTGIGMSEELCAKLFRMNEKVGTPGTEGELSTGLGLMLCKEFVEKHGGQIWVESQENIGSTFYFTIHN
jgi:two-component system, cell cycle sensor histidine kinase and response regulator CckA